MTNPETKPEVIDSTNIRDESYYNLCQLQTITHYADPIGAARSGVRFSVKRDECGNVINALILN